MFTGIIQSVGSVSAVESKGTGIRLGIHADEIAESSQIGDSISANGICLTITSLAGGTMFFDLSEETIRRTNLEQVRKGDAVNLEPAVRASDRLGGHLVTGHIDGIGIIKRKRRTGNSLELEIGAHHDIMQYVVEKGSIAVDGISLTVANLSPNAFRVAIIPYTETATTIGTRNINDTVNLETDIIGKYVAKFLHSAGCGDGDESMLRKLEKSGFL